LYHFRHVRDIVLQNDRLLLKIGVSVAVASTLGFLSKAYTSGSFKSTLKTCSNIYDGVSDYCLIPSEQFSVISGREHVTFDKMIMISALY
jgi:hypothetical protein